MRANIVIVSDAEPVVREVATAVAAAGIPVSVVDSGAECARQLRTLGPKTVVIELGEPGYEGDTAWRARRALAELWHREPRVIVLSRLAEAETRNRAERLGAALVLTAPFDVGQLLEGLADQADLHATM